MSLRAAGLKKSFENFSVSLDFSVGAGETLALVGHSGSGKTTALNLVAGLAEMDAGELIINGEDAGALPCWKRNVSVVFQDLALFPHLDVGGNIAYGLFVRKVPKKERKKIIDSSLELVRLPGYASRRVHTLSGGEKQRVAIARALACNPSALLLDEPFSSLDAPLRKEMRLEFLEIRARSDAPCVFVTHDREEAAMLGDRLALMVNGRIIETGTPSELFLTPKTEAASRFFGAGQVLPCEILATRQAVIEVSSPLGLITVQRGSEFDPARPMLFVPHDAVTFDGAQKAGLKTFTAKCAGAIFDGAKFTVRLLLNGNENWQRSNGAESFEPFPFEVITGVRTPPPACGSEINLSLDQSLARFVK